MTDLEKQIETEFADWAIGQGCLPLRLIGESFRGWPDRTVFCPGGRVVVLEFKRPNGARSKHQKRWLGTLRKLGFEAHFVDSVDQAKGVLRD